MDRILFRLGTTEVSLELAALAGGALMLALLAALLLAMLVQSRRQAGEAAVTERRRQEAERQLADLMRIQSEMTGRMQTMAEIFGSRSSDLARLVNDRLDAQSQRVGQAIETTGQQTGEQGGGGGVGGGTAGGSGPGTVPADIPDGRDDDIVARQLREAAMKETDPELRERLWEEYRQYKKSTT